MAITSAFQADDTGSIPVTCSIENKDAPTGVFFVFNLNMLMGAKPAGFDGA